MLHLDEYLVPTQFGEDEFYEKKSHFIGRVWPVESEEEALEKIQAMKKQHYDATHNCWAYIIKDGAVRFSDDGEPGGTAGMPMLQVLQREGLYNIVCVVTRYFGGIMLGAGGLVRAYSHTAKIALDAGGIITMALCKIVKVQTDYNFYGRLVPLICEEGGIVEDTVFADNVEVTFRIPEEDVAHFEARLVDVSNGRFHSEVVDQRFCEI